jgi:hypothetical protein
MFSNRLPQRVVALAPLWLVGCMVSKQYTLKLDPNNPQNNALCERSSRDRPDAPPECHPVTSTTLDGPSTMSVELNNADPARTYTAHVEQVTQSAASQVPKAVIAEVISRFGDMVKTVAGKDPQAPIGSTTLLSADAAASLDKGLRTLGLEGSASAVLALRDAAAPPAPPALVIDGTWKTPGTPAHFYAAQTVLARDPNLVRPLFGVGTDLPPARDRPFPPDATAQLVAAGFSQATVEDELARHVADACGDFGTEPYDGKNTPWAPYLEALSLAQLRGPEVLRDIGIDAAALVELFRGKDTSALDKLRDARNAAKKAYEAGARPTPAQHIIHLLYATSALYEDTSVCEQNLDFVLPLAKDARLKATLATARANAVRVKASARVGSDLFRAFIDPMVTRSVVEALTAGGDTRITFGAISLRPGTVNVTVADNATPAKQVANYEFRVASSGSIAISVGPMITACDGCFETVTEEIRSGEDGMAARTLRRDRRGFGSGVATLLQFPLVSDRWFELGPCIGYPISEINGATKAILAGLSFGHRAGVSITAGVHLFGTRRLKGGYGDVIDTSQPGLAALTAESVTTPTYAAAFFLSLNISTALLSRAGSGTAHE